MAFCTNVPIQLIAGSECIGDSLEKINSNFSALGETTCLLLSTVSNLSAQSLEPNSSDTIQVVDEINGIQFEIKDESVRNKLLAFEGGSFCYRNKIINGDMIVSQRWGGNAVTIDSSTPKYSVDRWYGVGRPSSGTFTLQRLTNTNGTKFLRALVTNSAPSIGANDFYGFAQKIEGYSIRNFRWGSTSASSVVLSFWARVSTPVSIGGSLTNGAETRSYPFSYELTTTNWEHVSITIPGDTLGSWSIDSQVGLIVNFSLGAGINRRGNANLWADGNFKTSNILLPLMATQGITLDIQDVQLEQGFSNTPFECIPYDLQLQQCKRFYEKSYLEGTPIGTSTPANAFVFESPSFPTGSRQKYITIPLTVEKRAIPGIIESYSIQGTKSTATTVVNGEVGTPKDLIPSLRSTSKTVIFESATTEPFTAGTEYLLHWAVDAEL
jgi:hypothetical protein